MSIHAKRALALGLVQHLASVKPMLYVDEVRQLLRVWEEHGTHAGVAAHMRTVLAAVMECEPGMRDKLNAAQRAILEEATAAAVVVDASI